MNPIPRHFGLQALVFSLVTSTFMTIYITQPVLSVIRSEFGVSAFVASMTVSAVILGIARRDSSPCSRGESFGGSTSSPSARSSSSPPWSGSWSVPWREI